MSKKPTYENITFVLSEFVTRYGIITSGQNTVHSLFVMVRIMVTAATNTASASRYTAALRNVQDTV